MEEWKEGRVDGRDVKEGKEGYNTYLLPFMSIQIKQKEIVVVFCIG